MAMTCQLSHAPAAVSRAMAGFRDAYQDALLEKAEKALEENGAESDDEKIEGTEVTTWTFKTGDPQNNIALPLTKMIKMYARG